MSQAVNTVFVIREMCNVIQLCVKTSCVIRMSCWFSCLVPVVLSVLYHRHVSLLANLTRLVRAGILMIVLYVIVTQGKLFVTVNTVLYVLAAVSLSQYQGNAVGNVR